MASHIFEKEKGILQVGHLACLGVAVTRERKEGCGLNGVI